MSRVSNQPSRLRSSVLYLVSLLAGISLFAAACSNSEAAQLTEPPEPAPTAPESDFIAPDGLAFADGPLTLRVSVPELALTGLGELDETDAVQVLIADLLTDGLTRRSHVDGSIEPAVADSWSTSPDGLMWTFQLGSATFSDGSTITADDVVESLTKVAALGSASVSGPNLWPIDGWIEAGEAGSADAVISGLQAVTDDQVEIRLTEPFAPLPEILSGVSFGVWPSDPVDGEDEGVVGSAVDFALDDQWTDGLRFVGEQADGEISAIDVLLDPDFTMLRAGETDMAVGWDGSALDGLTGMEIQRSAESYFAMNASLAPLDDVMIRQAILRAVDVEELRNTYFPDAGVMRGFIPQGVAGGVADACANLCELDLTQAETLVQASPNSDVEITVDFIDPSKGQPDPDDGGVLGISVEEQLASSIAETLRGIGLNATATAHTEEEFAAALVAGELGMFRFGSVSTTLSAETDIGLSFHSTGRDNVTATSIGRVDELIDEARTTDDPEERAALYADAERVLFGEAVVLPFLEFRHQLALGDTLESAGLEPDGSLNLAEISFAEVEEPILQGE